MIVPMKILLEEAAIRGIAVGAFNVYSVETVQGAMDAALRTRTPIVLAFGEAYLKNSSLAEIAGIVGRRADSTQLPVALHLDHCKDSEIIRQALDNGFTSVMYDGSALPFSDNVIKTAEAVRLASGYGVSVEGELGSLAAGLATTEGSKTDVELYTDPRQVKEFVSTTGVDALAVSIGTVHGFYKRKPDIRLDILDAIRKETSVPLVLHGGSGLPAQMLTECIRRGIRKINVNTELSFYTVSRIAAALAENPSMHLSQLNLRQIAYFTDIVAQYITIFGKQQPGEAMNE